MINLKKAFFPVYTNSLDLLMAQQSIMLKIIPKICRKISGHKLLLKDLSEQKSYLKISRMKIKCCLQEFSFNLFIFLKVVIGCILKNTGYSIWVFI